MFTRSGYGLLCAALALMLSPLAAHAVEWGTVGRACLPEEGRMLRDRVQPCHCPPESFCPQDMAEWETHPRMPDYQALICCPLPRECDVLSVSSTACGTTASTTINHEEFCAEYEPILVVTGPKRAGESDAQYTARRNRDRDTNNDRRDAADDANKCIETNCTPISDAIEANDPASNAARFDQLRTCYNTCNGNAADEVAAGEIRCDRERTYGICTSSQPLDCSDSSPTDGGGGDGGGGDGGGDCVTPDAMVLMADGTEKRIADIKPGDVVAGYTSSNKVISASRMSATEERFYTINEWLKVTARHPLLTNEGWKVIEEAPDGMKAAFDGKLGVLKEGDELAIKGGTTMKVASIKRQVITTPQDFINISTDGDQTFIVDGVVLRSYETRIRY